MQLNDRETAFLTSLEDGGSFFVPYGAGGGGWLPSMEERTLRTEELNRLNLAGFIAADASANVEGQLFRMTEAGAIAWATIKPPPPEETP